MKVKMLLQVDVPDRAKWGWVARRSMEMAENLGGEVLDRDSPGEWGHHRMQLTARLMVPETAKALYFHSEGALRDCMLNGVDTAEMDVDTLTISFEEDL